MKSIGVCVTGMQIVTNAQRMVAPSRHPARMVLQLKKKHTVGRKRFLCVINKQMRCLFAQVLCSDERKQKSMYLSITITTWFGENSTPPIIRWIAYQNGGSSIMIWVCFPVQENFTHKRNDKLLVILRFFFGNHPCSFAIKLQLRIKTFGVSPYDSDP